MYMLVRIFVYFLIYMYVCVNMSLLYIALYIANITQHHLIYRLPPLPPTVQKVDWMTLAFILEVRGLPGMPSAAFQGMRCAGRGAGTLK